MNIYSYFNSKDVAEYLEKIGFRFTALEMARIIEHCDHITLEEKHEAFRLLMEEMPDEVITIPETRENGEEETMLSTFLNEYIVVGNKLAREFDEKEENCLYSCNIKKNKAPPVDSFFCDYTWEEFQKGRKEPLTEEYPYVHLSKFNRIKRETTRLCLDKNGNVLFVENIKALRKFYAALSFRKAERKFPLPFKKGDLVRGAWEESDPFVFLDAGIDSVKGYALLDEKFEKVEDFTIPIELEYHREELKGVNRVFGIASAFEKGEIGLAEFANQYHKIRLEGYVDKIEFDPFDSN